jgi:hypothetical protein
VAQTGRTGRRTFNGGSPERFPLDTRDLTDPDSNFIPTQQALAYPNKMNRRHLTLAILTVASIFIVACAEADDPVATSTATATIQPVDSVPAATATTAPAATSTTVPPATATSAPDPTATSTTTPTQPAPTSEPTATIAPAEPTAAVGSEFDQALADQGKTLYEGNFCSRCHSRGSDRIVGPGHQNVYETAKTRVPGMSPEDYLRQSILDPGAFVVPGFPAIMPSFDSLDDNQILALIEYLKSL